MAIPATSPSDVAGPPTARYPSAFATLTVLFFMWGFITCMNDLLIPFLKKVFELSYFQSMLIQFTFFGAYFIGSLVYFLLSVRRGDPIGRMGYKNGILAGLLLSVAGCLLFYPAVTLRVYGIFLGGLFVLGLGFTLLQVAANPYVIILGPPETAPSRLNLSQAFTSLGSTIAPVVGGHLVFSFFSRWGTPLLNTSEQVMRTDAGTAVSENSLLMPYLLFAGLFLAVAALIQATKLPTFTGAAAGERGAGAWRYGHLRRGMGAIFCYVGGEVCIGSFLINYLHETAHIPETTAKTYLAFYWGGLMIGRFMGAIAFGDRVSGPRRWAYMAGTAVVTALLIYGVVWVESDFKYGLANLTPFFGLMLANLGVFYVGGLAPHRTLLAFSVAILALLTGALLTEGVASGWLLVGVGLFNSVLWSNIFTLAIRGLGKHTSQGSSLLIMAILGGAVLPLLQGLVADGWGIHRSFLVPLACYVYVAYYGWRGYAVRTAPEQNPVTA